MSALTYEEKILLHVETALAFAKIGTLPAALLDHPVFIRLVGLYSRDSYVPPCARFIIAADGPCLDCAEDGMIANQTAEMEFARVYFKGLAFGCLCFDAWTPRSGFPFIGVNTTYLTAPMEAHAREHARPVRRAVASQSRREADPSEGKAHGR